MATNGSRSPNDRVMIGMLRPEGANFIQPTTGVRGPPKPQFAGPVSWSCAFCGTLLVHGVSESYAEHGLPCYQCGEWNRTPYPSEKR